MKPVSDMQFACPACNAIYQQRPGIEGRKVRCKCGYVGRVPSVHLPASDQKSQTQQDAHPINSDRAGKASADEDGRYGTQIQELARAQRSMIAAGTVYALLVVAVVFRVLPGALSVVVAAALLVLNLWLVLLIHRTASQTHQRRTSVVFAGLAAAAASLVTLSLMAGIYSMIGVVFFQAADAGQLNTIVRQLETAAAIHVLLGVFVVVKPILIMIIAKKANGILRDYGFKVGFFGPDMSQFKTT